MKEFQSPNIELSSGGCKTDSSSKLLILAVLVAALLRIVFLIWASKHGVIIDNEGAEYARIAENLRTGQGYMGMFNNGVQLNFPPLFPLLIAALSFLLPNAEIAARVVNIVAGAALVIPVFKLAERIYNRKVACIVAVMVACHPLLIARSISTYAEGVYLTFLMCGVFYVVRWVEEQTVRACIYAGGFFGLAYLVRPEAFVVVGVITVAGLAWAICVHNRRRVLIGVLSLAAIFVLVASPYIAFLSINSGKFRIEGKGSILYAWGTKLDAGMSVTETFTKIGEDLSEEGVFMKSNYDALNAASYTPFDMIAYFLRSAPENLKTIYYGLWDSRSAGAPVLFMLVFIGLLRTAWDRRRVVNEGILLITGLVIMLTLLTVRGGWMLRYFYFFMGLLLLWAGKGAEELYNWSHCTLSSLSAPRNVPRFVSLAVQWLVVFLVIAISLKGVPKEDEFFYATLTERKVAGQWLAEHSTGPQWIMSQSMIPAYYAGGKFMFLPFASSDIALRYISKKKPDLLVLLEYEKKSRPYLAQWFDEGIPDPRAELIYDEGDSHHERIKIYRWTTDQVTGGKVRQAS
jgi:4-amino-4-deoxy-L-arabinose transferase-like glycosyltransferase